MGKGSIVILEIGRETAIAENELSVLHATGIILSLLILGHGIDGL